MPTITADDVRIRPGRLDGSVSSVNPAASTFVVALDSVGDPFGAGVLNDPVICGFATAVMIERDAVSIAEFFALFDALQAGETLDVRLFGVSDGSGGIIAHRIRVEVK